MRLLLFACSCAFVWGFPSEGFGLRVRFQFSCCHHLLYGLAANMFVDAYFLPLFHVTTYLHDDIFYRSCLVTAVTFCLVCYYFLRFETTSSVCDPGLRSSQFGSEIIFALSGMGNGDFSLDRNGKHLFGGYITWDIPFTRQSRDDMKESGKELK